MKFKVSRTSLWHREQPCDEAKLSDDLDKYNLHYWVLELNSLNDLIEFIKKYRPIVIDEPHNLDMFALEIYDTYRE